MCGGTVAGLRERKQEKLRQTGRQRGSGGEGKEGGSWQRAEEENISATHYVMSLCGLG